MTWFQYIPINSVFQCLKSGMKPSDPQRRRCCHLMVSPSLWCNSLVEKLYELLPELKINFSPTNVADDTLRVMSIRSLPGTILIACQVPSQWNHRWKSPPILICFDHDTQLISCQQGQQGSSTISPWQIPQTSVTADLALCGWTQIPKWTWWCKQICFYDGYSPDPLR